MKLKYILVSCNNDPTYYNLYPMVKPLWEKQGIKCILVFIGKTLPDSLQTYQQDIIIFEEIEGISSVFIAQTIRLLMPSLIETDGAVMISDIDTIPLKIDYFINTIKDIDDDKFVNLGYVPERLHSHEYYICYNIATPRIWSEVFKINSIDDVTNTIKQWYLSNGKYYYNRKYRSKCIGYHCDQRNLYKHINEWNQNTGNFILIKKDFDRIGKKYTKNELRNIFKTKNCIDYQFVKPIEKNMSYHQLIIYVCQNINISS